MVQWLKKKKGFDAEEKKVKVSDGWIDKTKKGNGKYTIL